MKEGLRLRWSRRPQKDNSSKAENRRENLGNQASRSTEAEGRHRQRKIPAASVGKQIELLGKQIDKLKKRGEIVSHNKNFPFNNDILVQVVEPGFRVPDLQRYDGTKDPYEHIAAFEMVMNLHGQPGPIMAKLFATTLTGKAQEWFTSLPRGSIESYEQLIQKFSFHFASKKKQKRSATHLFNIRQREDETLKSFIILIHGLKKGPFTSALARDPPSDVEQLMALAQKYIDEEEMNAMKESERREREQACVKVAKAYQCGKDISAIKFPVGARLVKTKSGGVDRERNPSPSKTDKVPANRSNAPTKGVIYTIAGGSSVGDSQRTQKMCARTLGSSKEREFVLKVEEEEAISFDSSDRPVDSGTMNNPMVIKLDIANFIVHKTPLVGFGGSEVASLGMIELPVSMGEEPKRKTLMTRPELILSSYFYVSHEDEVPTDNGIGEVACDQKEESSQKKRKVGEDAEPRPYQAEHMKPSDECKAV
ncbi:UNVERIFIED_CONTAM: hypothetical protein Sindi_2486700 [Sesamum indicum]